MSKFSLFDTNGVPIKAWVDGVPVEESAKQQLKNISGLPFIYKHLAVMPDVHLGKGATVGSVIPTKGAIIPASVGVDGGCGIIAQQISLTAFDLPDNLFKIREEIERAVPHGFISINGRSSKGNWVIEPNYVLSEWSKLNKKYDELVYKYPKIKHECPQKQLGTLGGGNHFLELCIDENDCVWVMLHSGSRGAGNKIGTFFIEQAKREMERWHIHLPDKDLSYIAEGSELFDDYIDALDWAQNYAKINRECMMRSTLNVLHKLLPPFTLGKMAVNCHHNYVEKENHYGENVWVTRKGAVRAREDDLGVIPGSMGAKSYVVRGKGNKESFCSCSHGAGRKMSRSEASKTFTVEDHESATTGVECRKDIGIIDETPAAYKDIDAVMIAQSDLIEVVHTLKQVLCVKG